MERKGAVPSLWQRQTLSTKGESDGLSSSKIIISHPFELTRSGSANVPSMLCLTRVGFLGEAIWEEARGTAGDHKGPPSLSPPPSPLRTVEHVSKKPTRVSHAVFPAESA